MKITAISAASVVALGLMAGATAQTPDGDTPANEGVCDPLVGGTPGLYGLCVAYCEAQDFLDPNPGDPPANKILNVYNKRRNAGDPGMPCVQEPCPCWSEEDLDVALSSLTACFELTGDADLARDGVSIFGPSPSALNVARLFLITESPTIDQCFFIVQQQGLPNSGVRRELFVTKEQGAICEASARQHAASLGVPCEIP